MKLCGGDRGGHFRELYTATCQVTGGTAVFGGYTEGYHKSWTLVTSVFSDK